MRRCMGTAAAAAVIALGLGGIGCGNELGQCVATYQYEGTVVKDDYTRDECEDECATIGGYIDCYFEPY